MTAFSEMEQPSRLFLKHEYAYQGVVDLDLWFWCPGCMRSHCINAAHWTFNGDYDRPTFDPSYRTWIDPSPRATKEPYISGFNCHSYIRDGQIQFLTDSTHKLAGQTVDMEAVNDHLGRMHL